MAVDAGVERHGVGHALQPHRAETQFGEVAVALRRCCIKSPHGGGLDVNVAGCSGHRVAGQAAATQAVPVVAAQGCHQDLGFSVNNARRGVHTVLKSLVIKSEQCIQIGIARADQRIAAVNAGNFCRALGLQA